MFAQNSKCWVDRERESGFGREEGKTRSRERE